MNFKLIEDLNDEQILMLYDDTIKNLDNENISDSCPSGWVCVFGYYGGSSIEQGGVVNNSEYSQVDCITRINACCKDTTWTHGCCYGNLPAHRYICVWTYQVHK